MSLLPRTTLHSDSEHKGPMKSSKSNLERNMINWAEKGDDSEWIIVDD
jgi:hypothetical protein